MTNIAIAILIFLTFFSCNQEPNKDNKRYVNFNQCSAYETDDFNDHSEVDYPNELFTAFIPHDYMIHDFSAGDLDQDGQKDFIILLRRVDVDNYNDCYITAENPPKRPLLILLQDANGELFQAHRSDFAIYSCMYNSKGDPYESITIENGRFIINYWCGSNMGSGMYSKRFVFNYSDKYKDWMLEKILNEISDLNAFEIPPKEVLNKEDFGRVKFSNLNVYRVVDW